MKKDLPTKWYLDDKEPKHPVQIPEESFGICKTAKHKGMSPSELAIGYCLECWDRGWGGCLTQNDEQKLIRDRKRNYKRKEQTNE